MVSYLKAVCYVMRLILQRLLLCQDEVFTMMEIQVVVVRVGTSCSDVVGYHCFEAPCFNTA
jgi:hypothetical protein